MVDHIGRTISTEHLDDGLFDHRREPCLVEGFTKRGHGAGHVGGHGEGLHGRHEAVEGRKAESGGVGDRLRPIALQKQVGSGRGARAWSHVGAVREIQRQGEQHVVIDPEQLGRGFALVGEIGEVDHWVDRHQHGFLDPDIVGRIAVIIVKASELEARRRAIGQDFEELSRQNGDGIAGFVRGVEPGVDRLPNQRPCHGSPLRRRMHGWNGRGRHRPRA